jgi:hypothetical protein
MATESEVEVQPLLVPFDISLPAPTLRADDAPSQKVAHTSALCAATAVIDHGDKFNEAGVIRKPLSYFKRVYETKNMGVALELIHKRTQVDLGSSDMLTASDCTELSWNMDNHYIDLMICVPVGLGLAALLPNQKRLHNFEFALDLRQPYRTFSAKFAKLGFDPTGSMLWIGRSYASEDVWLAWAPTESLQMECEDVAPGTCRGSTQLKTRHYHITTMFLASMLKGIGYGDLTVSDAYPDLENKEDMHFATNLM